MGFFDRSAEAIRAGLRERVFEPRALREAQRKSPKVATARAVEPSTLGRAEIGEQLAAGVFSFEGWTVQAAPEAFWRAKPPRISWAEAAHRFGWLADLDALGAGEARRIAGVLIDGWIQRHRRYDTLAWRADLAAERLWRWLDSEAFGGAEASERRLASVSAHVLWLERHWPETPAGIEAIRVATALTRACLMLDGLDAHHRFALARLNEALDDGLLEDGAPISRNPAEALEIFERLQVLREAFAEAAAPADARAAALEAVEGEDPDEIDPAHVVEADLGYSPDALAEAMPRLAQALRFWRRADGGLPLFHGAQAIADGRLDAALARARLPGAAPAALEESGYARFSGARVSAMMDVGGPPVGIERAATHKSPLAIELTAGRRRVIVNCGDATHLGGDWVGAGRSLAGHSTIAMVSTPAERAAFAPTRVAADRRTERNGEWLYGAHDGFAESHGVRVSRRMFLTADGGDFRGEDVVETHGEGARISERRIAKAPRAERANGLPFEVRFHLHPDVEAELVADGEAVALRLPHGENWVMRQAGGRLSLAPSFYVDALTRPRSTTQIVATSGFSGEKSFVRWAFRRVGELAQQPRDVEALLESVEGKRVIDGALDEAHAVIGGGRATSPLEGLGRPPFLG